VRSTAAARFGSRRSSSRRISRRWFDASEQIATALDVAVVSRADEPLGDVAGVRALPAPATS
jgi:hypothetical protein